MTSFRGRRVIAQTHRCIREFLFDTNEIVIGFVVMAIDVI